MKLTLQLAITIYDALGTAITSLPDAEVGQPYNFTCTVTGGKAPYKWSSPNLPAGLTINQDTGVISGTPTTAGAVTVEVDVQDSVN